MLNAGAEKIRSSFESGELTGWNSQGKGWSVYAKAGSDGEKSAMCIVEKGEEAGLKALAREIEKAEPGWMVKVDLAIAGRAKSQSSKASVVLMCVDKDGTPLREVKKEISKPETGFQRLSLPEVVVPSGTVETYLMLVVEVKQTSGAKEWWRFDNIVIDVK